MCAKLLLLCLTLWEAMDCSLPGSSAHSIIQARILKWVAMLSSRSSHSRDETHVSCVSCIDKQILHHWATGKAPYWTWSEVKLLSHVYLFVTPWTVAYQAPPSMDFPGKSTGGVSISFSRWSFWPRDWTKISHIVDRCFTIWATREVLVDLHHLKVCLLHWQASFLPLVSPEKLEGLIIVC